MSTPKPSRLTSFLKDAVIPCLVIGGFAFYGHQEVAGFGLVIVALVLRLTLRLETRLDEIEAKMPASPAVAHADEAENYDDGIYELSLTTPFLEKEYGWENLTVYKQPAHYVRTLCCGGPPVSKTTWEYEIKKREFVFQRLRDDFTEEIWEPYFEVANGCVQEHLIRRRDAENDSGLKFSTPEKDIADFKHQVE